VLSRRPSRLLTALAACCGLSSAAAAQPQPATPALEELALRAEESLQKQQYAEAERLYRDVLFEGWSILGSLDRMEGRAAESREALGRAARAGIVDPDRLQALAVSLLQSKDPDRALAILLPLAQAAPRHAERQRLLAKALAAAGRGDEAARQLDLAAQVAQGDAEATFLVASDFVWMKQPEKAAALFAEVVAARPLPQTHILIGRAYRDAGEYARATAALQAALKLDPSVPRAHYYLGMVRLADAMSGEGRLEAAMAEFRAELRVSPADPAANDQLGLALLDADRPQEALGPLEAAVRALPRPQHLLHLGRCLFQLGRVEESVMLLERALQESRDPAEQGRLQFQLGLALRKLGQAERAARALAESRRLEAAAQPAASGPDALPMAPETSPLAELPLPARAALRASTRRVLTRASLNAGILRAQREAFDEAAVLIADAASLEPAFPRVQASLGIAYFNARRFDAAVPALERALASDAADLNARRLLALACIETRAWARAIELLGADEAREGDPALQFAYATALVRSGRAAEGLPLLRGLQRRGESPELALVTGEAQAQLGDFDAARAALYRALRARPDLAPAQAALGEVYLKEGRPGEAVAPLEEAARLLPKDASVHARLAEAYRQTGDAVQADKHLALARSLEAEPARTTP
jgi:tetratricopeptide (TPR) repeat protein